MLSLQVSTVITLSSQPLSCEARRTFCRYGQSPAPGYRLQRRYPWCVIFIHHDRSNVCRCHCVNHKCAGLSSHRTISIRSPPSSVEPPEHARHAYLHRHLPDRYVFVGFHRDFRTRTRIASRCFNSITSSPISGTSIRNSSISISAWNE